MKILSAFILLLGIIQTPALAQKAYQALNYRCNLTDANFELTLGNGYLAASKIRRQLFSPHSVLFYPDNAIPDFKGRLTFHAKGKTDYFVLDNMQEFYKYSPKTITGHYWSGKTWSVIRFALGR